MNFVKNKIAAILTVVALSPAATFAHDSVSQANGALGNPAQAAAATRTVAIKIGTKNVNVNQGDVVTFEVAGQAFTWQFDTLRPSGSFDLAEISPHGLDTLGVRVYVAANPLYRN